jgi:hypothetical protein
MGKYGDCSTLLRTRGVNTGLGSLGLQRIPLAPFQMFMSTCRSSEEWMKPITGVMKSILARGFLCEGAGTEVSS